MKQLHVGIVGAGLGGLCLAQGLIKAGIQVEVFEKDSSPDTRGQGYRLRINADGQRALALCLSEAKHQLFRQSCASYNRSSLFIGPDMLLQSMRAPANWQPNLDIDMEESEGDLSANRQTLREILCGGLADRLHFGQKVVAAEESQEGVTLTFADGHCKQVDLLVAAEGSCSLIRESLLPGSSPANTGGLSLYGKTPLRPDVLDQLDPSLLQGVTVVFENGFSLVVEPMRFGKPLPQLALHYAPDCQLTQVEDYLYWTFIGQAASLGGPWLPDSYDGDVLLDKINHITQRWHPALRQIFSLAEQASLSTRPILMASSIAQWKPGRITFVGDAIHALSPAAGLGANTAFCDAAVLAKALAEVQDLTAAVGSYEADMRQRGEYALQLSREAAEKLFQGYP